MLLPSQSLTLRKAIPMTAPVTTTPIRSFKRIPPRAAVTKPVRPAPVHSPWLNLDVSWDYSRPEETASPWLQRVELPEPARWSGALALAVIESMLGCRRASALERWMVPNLYTALDRRVALARRLNGPMRIRRPQLRSSRMCAISARTYETTHIVTDGANTRGVGIRLEARRSQWIATAIEIA